MNDAMNVGEKYYRDRWKFQRFKEKPVLLVKWDLSPVQGLGELEVVECCHKFMHKHATCLILNVYVMYGCTVCMC